jgi:hypothetical protein
MKMFKGWIHDTFFYGGFTAGFVLFCVLVLVAGTAGATGNGHNDDGNEQDQTQGQGQAQGQGQTQGQEQGQTVNVNIGGGTDADGQSTGGPLATSEGGAQSTSVGGNNSLTSNTSAFFAFSSRLPSAGECFGAIEGGGGGGSGGGFLGWRPLNNDCWFSALAEAEENVQVRARLKCASKMFRNAISYTAAKKDRQTHCVGFMVRTYIEQIDYERDQVQSMIDAQTLIIQDHTTKETERTSASVTRAVESCTDCFGVK